MKPGRDPLTLAELQRRFSDEEKCLVFLERARWPNGPVCPRCGSANRASSHLLTTAARGISSLKLASLLGLQYRTTWHLTHRIRAMMESDPELLRGIVELDETYIGGKPRKRNRPMPPAPMPLFDKPEAVKPEPKRKDRKDRKKRERGGGHTMAFTAVQRGGKADGTITFAQH